MKAKTILAVIGDTHAGGTTALSLPKFITDEGQEITATLAQQWLYENWLDYWQWIKERAGIRGKHRTSRLVVVHLGDLVDGNHHQTTQALPNLEDQETMACELLRPIAALADGGYYQIRGTEAHAGPGSQSEVRIARELGARACEYELDLNIDGILYNFTHHGRPGTREWTSGAAGMAADLVMQRVKDGLPIPQLAFRAHGHTVDDSGIKNPLVRLMCSPSWQLKTAFGFKVAAGKRSDIGGYLVEGLDVDATHARYKAAPGQVRTFTI